MPSIDETKLFLYRGVGLWTWDFLVYDVLEDLIIFQQTLVPGAGRMALTPDGQKLFITNPGAGLNDPWVEPGFEIYNVNSNTVDTLIEDREYFSVNNWFAHPNHIVVTPDGRWLVILGGSPFRFALIVYDIEKGELIFKKYIGHFVSDPSTQLWE